MSAAFPSDTGIPLGRSGTGAIPLGEIASAGCCQSHKRLDIPMGLWIGGSRVSIMGLAPADPRPACQPTRDNRTHYTRKWV